ncbi:hypothetical protein [Maribellus sediminis]|uniref:hypothetical protein n=1 Tax=Maribellus sediminis TaxID=2696285 RepID=UPI001431D342|nr:hypothetical protein [Maribellus sediminis]
MKKIAIKLFGLLLITLFYYPSQAQINSFKEKTSYNLHRSIEMQKDSDVKEIKIEVTEEDCIFNLRVQSTINAGSLKLEIFDPTGKNQGNFSIGCQIDLDNTIQEISQRKSKVSESVHGLTSKLINNPKLGNWIVKISPQKTTGKIIIDFNQDIVKTKQEK